MHSFLCSALRVSITAYNFQQTTSRAELLRLQGRMTLRERLYHHLSTRFLSAFVPWLTAKGLCVKTMPKKPNYTTKETVSSAIISHHNRVVLWGHCLRSTLQNSGPSIQGVYSPISAPYRVLSRRYSITRATSRCASPRYVLTWAQQQCQRPCDAFVPKPKQEKGHTSNMSSYVIRSYAPQKVQDALQRSYRTPCRVLNTQYRCSGPWPNYVKKCDSAVSESAFVVKAPEKTMCLAPRRMRHGIETLYLL